LREKIIKKKVSLSIIFILILNIFFWLSNFSVDSKFYVVKDKEGNIIRFTSQYQISSKEKAAGFTITEKYSSPQTTDLYGFNKIDWEKAEAQAKKIEEALSAGKGKNIPYPEFRVAATAYTPHERSCWPYADGFTSTNYKAGYKSIAIDPEYGTFHYGDVLYVEGYGIGLANDCGSAIKGNRIDVCFNLGDEQRALNWGKKKVRVWILNRLAEDK
jgi:3D (Asp-Asp-Asp) domain-containing protein